MNPEDLKLKSEFLTTFYNPANKKPLLTSSNSPSEYALAAAAYGEPIPTKDADIEKLYQTGLKLLSTNLKMSQEKKHESETKNYSQISVIEDSDLEVQKLSNGLVRVPIARIGEWKHDDYGIVKFTQNHFDQIIDNHKKDVLGFESYLTYGHPKEKEDPNIVQDYLEEAKAFDAERKRGELKNVAQVDEVLYGDFVAKPDAVKAVDAGEYEYSSGEFVHDFTDKNTGENKGTVLVRTALTNAPFIPLKEKVKVLSQSISTKNVDNQEKKSQENIQNPHNTFNYIIKLSTGHSISNNNSESNTEAPKTSVNKDLETEPNINNNINKLTTTTVTNPAASPAAAAIVSNAQNPLPAEGVANPPVSTTAPAKNSNVAEVVKEAAKSEKESTTVEAAKSEKTEATLDIAQIIEQVTKKVSDQFAEAKKVSDETITKLTDEIASLKTDLTNQKEVALKFSQSLTRQDQVEQAQKLAAKGVSPALIQRFSTLASLVNQEGGNKVLKFSTNVEGKDTEVNSPLLKEVETLLIDAVNTQPLQVEKFGQTTPTDSGFVAGFKNIIAANEEKAKKLQAK